MAHFYGTIQGASNAVSRIGHSCLKVTAQSYEGDIVIDLIQGLEGDKVEIYVREHDHSQGTLLYSGFIKDLLDMEKRAAQMHALGVQKFTEGCSNE